MPWMVTSRWFRLTAILVLAAAALEPAAREPEPRGAAGPFTPVALYVDAGTAPLAAWQLEFTARKGAVRIVGIEGGEHAAFREPPYYDPRAMRGERVIIGAFQTGGNLPKGRTRVATVHVELLDEGDPGFAATLQAAATLEGEEIPARITWERGR
jgi:hypothetical protein